MKNNGSGTFHLTKALALQLESFYKEKAKEKQIESGGAVPQKSAKPPIETRQEIAKGK